MKATLTTAALLLMTTTLCAQHTGEPSKLAFRNGTELMLATTDRAIEPLGDGLNLRASAFDRNSKVYTYSTMPADVLEMLPITTDMTFYQAVEDGNGGWVALERDMESTAYNVVRFDMNRAERSVLFTDRSSADAAFAFRPIACPTPNLLLLEKLVFGSSDEHLGIWALNLTTHSWREVNVSDGYLTTPKVSPDGRYMAYAATTELPKDLHSTATSTVMVDIASGEEIVIPAPAGSWSEVLGWVPTNVPAKDLIKPDKEEEPEGMLKMQPTFELPWNTGVSYYVSRTGTPAPSGSTASTCYQNIGFNPHPYVAIDFDSPNGITDPVRASAAGTVIYAQISGSLTTGYGRLVKIRHSDNTITYYAHLSAIYVAVNDVVQQGCPIGDGGTTGDPGPDNDHIHFEWRDVGDVAFNTAVYPIFSECGCIPKANYCYISANSNGSCSSGGTTNLYRSTNSVSVNGNSVTINVTVINNGTASAGASTLGYYLSTNTTINTSDYLIGTDAVSSLSAGATSAESITVDMCNLSGVPNGTYYVGYIIDYQNVVAETNETENFRHWSSPQATRSCSSGSGANLYKSTSNLSVSGNTVSISVTVINNGTSTAGSSTLGYYLSTNTTISTTDYLIGTDAVSSLAAGATSAESITVDMCSLSGVPNGTYYVGYIIDYQNVVVETNESENNRYWSSPQATRICSNMGGTGAGMGLDDSDGMAVDNSDELHDDASTAGLESVAVFPNPSQGTVTVSIPVDVVGPVRIEVLDGLGRTLMSTKQLVAGQTENLDLSVVPDGLYHARLTTPNASHTFRLVIQR